MSDTLPVIGRRVLVVDDNRDVADMQASLLKMCGQSVRQAYDGHTALRIASEFKPEIVFLDLVMPGMDGLTLARRLRELEATREARLIALTAFSQQSMLEAIGAAGFDDHMAKPATASKIFHALLG